MTGTDPHSGARRGRAAVVLTVFAVVVCVLPWLLGDWWCIGPLVIGGSVAVLGLAWLTVCWVYDEWPWRGDRERAER